MRTLLILPVVGLLALGAQHGTEMLSQGPRASRPAPTTLVGGPLLSRDVAVVDGDTIRVRGRAVRLMGYDTPETHEPRCAEEARLGREATRELSRLVHGGGVLALRMRPDRDRHGRRLGRLTVDGRDVGRTLIAAGLARPYAGGRRRGWC